MSRYRAVFFDLDGTLVDERAGVQEARAAGAEALRSLGYDVPNEAFNAAIQLVIARTLDRYGGQWPGIWSREELMADVLRELGLGIAAAARIADAYAAARIGNLALVPGARQTLTLLSRRASLGLISNGSGAEQRAKLRSGGLNGYFRTTTISGDLGVAKPAPAIFHAALRSLGVRPHEAVHVGNNFEQDVAGAVGAEMAAIWLNVNGEKPVRSDCRATAVVRSLHELPALLALTA